MFRKGHSGGVLLLAVFLFCSMSAMAGSAVATHRVLHDADIESALFSRMGTTLATVDGGSLRFWDVATGELKEEFLPAQNMRFRVPMAIENGRFLLIGNDGVDLYDLETPRLVARLGHGFVKNIDYDFKTKRMLVLLARGGTPGNIVKATPELALYDLSDLVQGGWFANTRRAVLGADQPKPLVDILPPPPTRGYPAPNNHYAAYFLANPDEAVTFGIPESIVWSLATGREKSRFSTSYSFASALSADRSRFITCGFNQRSLELWALAPAKQIASLDIPGYIRKCRFRRDGSTLAVETQQTSKFTETVWRLEDGKRIDSIELDDETRGRAHAWSEDGKRYIVAGPGNTLRVYEAADDPVAIGNMAPGLLLADKMRRGPTTFYGVSGESLYVSPTGKQALWVFGVQAVLWQLP